VPHFDYRGTRIQRKQVVCLLNRGLRPQRPRATTVFLSYSSSSSAGGAIEVVSTLGAGGMTLSEGSDGADGAVSALDAKACLGAKVVGDGCDEPLCSTGGKEPQATFTLGLHWSGFAPEIFTMRSHLTMSSFR